MPNKVEAWAIFGPRRQKPHIDKIMASPAEAWGLLVDEQAPLTFNQIAYTKLSKGWRSPRISELRRKGYSCRKVTITWRNLRGAKP